MKKLSLIMLCLLTAIASKTFAQGYCNAAYSWAAAQTTSSPLGVLFTNTSSLGSGAPSTAYAESQVYFGDGSHNYIWYTTPHNYASPGTYNTMLVMNTYDSMTNALLCTDTAYQTVTINYSTCTVGITTAYNGNGSYTFTATNPSGATGLSYSWNFGDGATTTGNPVTHTYAASAYYNTTVTSSNSTCTSSASTLIQYIDSVINCDSLSAGINAYVSNATVSAYNSSTSTPQLYYLHVINIADWYWGDGASTLNQTVFSPMSHTYASPGTYTITEVNRWIDSLTNQVYCTDTATSVVTVGSIPTPSLCDSLHANYYVTAAGLNVVFHNTSASAAITPLPGSTYSVADWYFGDGSSQLGTTNASHTYASPGLYNITMINSWIDSLTNQVICTDTLTTQSLISTTPYTPVSCDSLFANFTPSTTGLTATFANTSYSNATVPFTNSVYPVADWYFGDGSSQLNSASGYHTYASPGTYTVFMLNTWKDSLTNQVYCIDSFANQITVNDLNLIRGNIYWDTMNTSIAYPDSIKIWLITHTFDSTTNILTAVDSEVVPGYFQFYQFFNKPAGDYLVKAAFIGQAVGTVGYVPTYHLSSIYWSSATNIYHAGGTTSGKDITMQTGTVTAGPGFIGGNISSGAGKGTGTGIAGIEVYLRNANNALVSSTITDANGDYTFPSIPTGTYSVYPELINYVTTPFNTITVSSTQTHVVAVDFEKSGNTIKPKEKPTPIATISKEDGLNIYPNPVKNQLIIENKNGLFNKLHIVNTLGQLVQENTLTNGTNKIQLSAINTGIYYLLISGADQSRSMKIIKE